ncbi:MAG: hypothetical protein H7Z43_14625 [Clostridia bacterium]|nr:hypothetical protein [Deltaproteobacteria bacterium]
MEELSLAVLALSLSLSIVPLIVRGAVGWSSIATVTMRVCGVVVLYLGWHGAAKLLMPVSLVDPNVFVWTLAGVAILGLFTIKATLQMHPQGRLARALYPWLFSGFYLDEIFTRMTFRIWPPGHRRLNSSRVVRIQESVMAANV